MIDTIRDFARLALGYILVEIEVCLALEKLKIPFVALKVCFFTLKCRSQVAFVQAEGREVAQIRTDVQWSR